MKSKIFIKSLLAVSIVSATTLTFAADAVTDKAEAEVERIIVTGSHIRKGDFESASPIKVIDASDIEGVGAVNIGELLAKLPSVSGDVTGSSSNISPSSSGLNTVALRNLGSSRTLVLVDGKRYVSGVSVGAGYGVDLNSIPTSLIDRVEVLTGGQSAAYGSDALAGVINIILKKDFDGVEFKAQVGQSGEGDREKKDFDLTVGKNFDGGNAWFSIGKSTDDGLMARDRDFARVHQSAVKRDGSAVNNALAFVGSSHAIDARMQTGNGNVHGDGRDFVRTDDVNTSSAFNFHEYRSIFSPLDRTTVASGLSLELSDVSRVNFNVNYARVDSRTRFEPIPLDSRNDIFKVSKGGVTGIDIATHPWFANTPAGDALLGSDASLPLDDFGLTFRRGWEFGDRGAENTRSTFRVAGEYEYDLPNDFYLTLSGVYGVTDQRQSNHGDINLERARQALTVESDGLGGYQCADPTARIAGCSPINPFTVGNYNDGTAIPVQGFSAEAINYLAADTNIEGSIEQTVLTALLAGDLGFEVSDDVEPVGFAAGIEYRKESGHETPDPLRQAGITRGAGISATAGEFDVVDVFAEVHIPVLEQLAFDVAVRAGDYSSVGSTFNWRVGFDAPMTDSFRLRGALATSVRAPNVSDLYAGGTATAALVNDPCNGVTAADTGNVADNCRSITAIQNRINNDGVFELTQVESQNTSGLLRGSETVNEETSDTLTLGAIYTPESIEGLSISLDYYDIKIDDAIANTDRTLILNRCHEVASGSFDAQCEGLVERDGVSGAALTVDSATNNENNIATSGLDFEASYETSIGSGVLFTGLSLNYLNNYSITDIETATETDYTGELLFPKIKFNLNTSYTYNDVNFFWQLRFRDATVLNNTNTADTKELNSVDTVVYNDIRVSYSLFEDSSVYIGVNNMFDEQPKIIGSNQNYHQAGTNSNGTAFDLSGRQIYAGINVKF
ncbi:MAG: iron complex outermembrane receptor protein [Colwellia sp.]